MLNLFMAFRNIGKPFFIYAQFDAFHLMALLHMRGDALDRTFDAATVYLMKGESYRGRNLKTYSIEISDPVE